MTITVTDMNGIIALFFMVILPFLIKFGVEYYNGYRWARQQPKRRATDYYDYISAERVANKTEKRGHLH